MNIILIFEEKHPQLLASLYQVVASFSFAAMGLTTKLARGIPPPQALYVRSVFTLILVSRLTSYLKVDCYPRNRVIRNFLVWRGVVGAVGTLAFYQAVQLAALSEVIVLSKLSPLWTALLGAFYLGKHKLSLNLIGVIILSIVGVICIAQPPALMHMLGVEHLQQSEYKYHVFGIMMGLLASFTQSIVQVMLSQLGAKVNQLTVLQFFAYFTVFSPVLYQLYSPFQEIRIPNTDEWVLLVLNAIFGSGAQLAMNRAFMIGDLNQISLLGQSQIIFSYIFDCFIVAQSFNNFTIVGTLLVCTSLIGMVWLKSSGEQQKLKELQKE